MRFSMGSIFSETNRSSWAFCFLMLVLLSFSMELAQSLNSFRDNSVALEINVDGEGEEFGEEEEGDKQQFLVQEKHSPEGSSVINKAIPTQNNLEVVSFSDIDVPPPRA